MKYYITLLLAFLYCSSSWSQHNDMINFQPLRVVETVSKETVDQIKIKDRIKESDGFFTQEFNAQSGLFLFEKKGNQWIVYDYNDFVSNYSVQKHVYHSERYVSVSVNAMRSGMGENIYGWMVLFDLEQKTYSVLNIYSHNSGEYSNGEVFRQECKSDVKFLKNNTLQVTRVCDVQKEDANYCDECLKSGVYTLK